MTIKITKACKGSASGIIELKINGGRFTIDAGIKKPYTEVERACTITKVRMLSGHHDTPGTVTNTTVDILRCTYAQFDDGSTHPVAGDKISASAPITLSAAVKSEDTTLTGWTKTLAKGDIICPNVLTNSAAQYLTIVLEVNF